MEYKQHPHKEVGEKRICPHTGERFNNTWSAEKIYDSCVHCNPKDYMPIGERLHKINEQRKRENIK